MAKHVKAPKEPRFTLGASSVLPCWHRGGKALTMVPQLSLEKNPTNRTRNFYWESLSQDQSSAAWSPLPHLAALRPQPCSEPDCTQGHQM